MSRWEADCLGLQRPSNKEGLRQDVLCYAPRATFSLSTHPTGLDPSLLSVPGQSVTQSPWRVTRPDMSCLTQTSHHLPNRPRGYPKRVDPKHFYILRYGPSHIALEGSSSSPALTFQTGTDHITLEGINMTCLIPTRPDSSLLDTPRLIALEGSPHCDTPPCESRRYHALPIALEGYHYHAA